VAPTFSPASLDFGEIPATQRTTLDVEIDNPTTASVPYALERDAGGRFSIVGGNGHIPAGGKHKVTVGFLSNDLPPQTPIAGALKAGSGTGAVSLALTATVTNPVSIEEDEIECGEALVGAEIVSVVKVRNAHKTATVTLSFTGVAAFEAMPATIPPSGMPQAVWVRFQPKGEGAAKATLSAAAAGFSDTASVTGTGVLEKLEDAGGEGEGGEPEQRFHIDVPNPHTFLGLGAKLHGYEASALSGFATNGIGLETKEDIYVNGMGPESRLWAQARKKVVIQSREESILSIAGDKHITSAGSVSYLLGTKGVLIGAGFPLLKHDPLEPLEGEYEPTSADNWGYGFIAMDIAVGVLMTGLSIKSLKDDWKETTWPRRIWEGIGSAAALGGVGADILAGAAIAPTTTILGAAGVAIASPAYVAVYGVAGIGLVSPFPTMIGLVDATVLARDDASVLALQGTANLKGPKVEIQADKKIEIAATTGKEGAELHGPVSIEGSHLELRADDKAVPGATRTGHAGHVQIDADSKVTIGVGKFLVRIVPDRVHVGMRSTANDDTFNTGKPLLVIDESGILIQAGPNDGQIDLRKDKAQIASGTKTALTTTPSALKLRSPDVKMTSDGALTIKGGIIKLG
jgi:hypothetical protein